jgi:rhodanese-related sulfurtransferase
MPSLKHRSTARVATIILVALAALLVAGCGGSSATPAASATSASQSSAAAVQKADPAQALGLLRSSVVIDVRTPEEFAAGHIAGARNINVEAPDFASKIADLDKGAAYLLYCRSGRRSAIAADEMVKAGFTKVVDGGGMADLVAAGATTE